tara:strand:+ start:138 stop:314 length:177 start_codon:yes stop_codon:yes gene_type:complete
MSLKKWFSENWVDIGSPKKVEDIRSVGVKVQKAQNVSIQNVFQRQKLPKCQTHKKDLR